MQAKYIVPELEESLAMFDVQVVTLKGQVEVVPKKLHKVRTSEARAHEHE